MGSSKKQTVCHRYLFGLHIGLSRGPLDELVKIQLGDREAWKGSITKTGRIFINNSSISAAGFRLRSDYFENSGSILSQADVEMKGQIAKLEGGDSTSGSITRFEVNKLKFNQYQVQSQGKLVLSVSDELSDAGGGSANLFLLADGFQMSSKPKKGDLLGTTISLDAPANAISVLINNSWTPWPGPCGKTASRRRSCSTGRREWAS